MGRSQYGPAAGASGGASPRLAGLKAPRFLRYDQAELDRLYHELRDPLVSHVFGLLCMHSDFSTGELLTTYARLMDLCTPPQPQSGPRRKGPTYAQMRRAVDDLVGVGLVRRGEQNEAQGQLRLYVPPRDGRSTSAPKANRERRRVSEPTFQRERRAANQ